MAKKLATMKFMAKTEFGPAADASANEMLKRAAARWDECAVGHRQAILLASSFMALSKREMMDKLCADHEMLASLLDVLKNNAATLTQFVKVIDSAHTRLLVAGATVVQEQTKAVRQKPRRRRNMPVPEMHRHA